MEHVFQKPFIPASTHCISHICLLRLAFLSLQMCLSMSTGENRASICKWTSPAYSMHTSRHRTNNSIWSQHASVGLLPWPALWKRSLGEEKAANPQEMYHCHIQHSIASWELPSAIILNIFFSFLSLTRNRTDSGLMMLVNKMWLLTNDITSSPFCNL